MHTVFIFLCIWEYATAGPQRKLESVKYLCYYSGAFVNSVMRYMELSHLICSVARSVEPVLSIDATEYTGTIDAIHMQGLNVDYCVVGEYSGNSANKEPSWVSRRRGYISPIVYGGKFFPVGCLGKPTWSVYSARCSRYSLPSLDLELELEHYHLDQRLRVQHYLQWRQHQLVSLTQEQVQVRLHWLDLLGYKIPASTRNP